MSFALSPGTGIQIDGQAYTVTEHPAAPGQPYGQEGRAGTVFQLLDLGGRPWALKVFKERFRVPSLVTLADRLAGFASIPGLAVCHRTVLTSRKHRALLRQFPELSYALLMPWVVGPTWLDLVVERRPVTTDHSWQAARGLLHLLVEMEERGLAHCDLSGPNLLLPFLAATPSPQGVTVALVDVEQMCAAELAQPDILPAGSSGYAHRTAPAGLWSKNADRFAGAVLLGEILAWCDPMVRRASHGESFFAQNELQKDSDRYRQLHGNLEAIWGTKLAALFQRAWLSQTLAECPAFGDWLLALPDTAPDMRLVDDAAAEQTRGGSPRPVITAPPLPAVDGADSARPATEGLDMPARRPASRQLLVLPTVVAAVICVIFACAGTALSSALTSRQPTATALTALDTATVTRPATADPSPSPEPALPSANALSSPTPRVTRTPRPTSTVPTPTPTPAWPFGFLRTSDRDGADQVLVPAGTLLMGAEPDQASNADERPQHSVYVNAFWIDRTEVSTGAFAQFVAETGYQTEAEQTGGAYVWNGGGWTYLPGTSWQAPHGPDVPAMADQPVTQVSWQDAVAYCSWAGRRLPTEAEWERAARGPVGNLYPWGAGLPDPALANYGGNVGAVTSIRSYSDGVSGFGALNLAGNVYEWVQDWYAADYYLNSPAENPVGPRSGRYRVMRGGSWQLEADRLRAFVREVSAPQYMNNNLGFRCAESDT